VFITTFANASNVASDPMHGTFAVSGRIQLSHLLYGVAIFLRFEDKGPVTSFHPVIDEILM
jgi:hypothetical protein